MKSILANLLTILVFVLAIGMIYYIVKGYFMMGVGDGYYYDGFGRTLYEPPWWVKIVWQDMQWPGLKWFIIDLVVFWVVVGVCSGLINLSGYLRKETEKTPNISN